MQAFQQPPDRRTGLALLDNLLKDSKQWRADVGVAKATRDVIAVEDIGSGTLFTANLDQERIEFRSNGRKWMNLELTKTAANLQMPLD